jgi:hypothetical protein
MRPSGSNGDSRPPRRRFQFGLRHLLVLTVVCAAILTIVRATGWPVRFQVVVAGYFMLLAAYVALRAVPIAEDLGEILGRLRQVRRRRKELGDEAQELKDRIRRWRSGGK